MIKNEKKIIHPTVNDDFFRNTKKYVISHRFLVTIHILKDLLIYLGILRPFTYNILFKYGLDC